MPIYEFKCPSCGNIYEEIISTGSTPVSCPQCGNTDQEKLISTTSSLTGKEVADTPASGGTGCCGTNPSVKGCVPGSCCGKA